MCREILRLRERAERFGEAERSAGVDRLFACVSDAAFAVCGRIFFLLQKDDSSDTRTPFLLLFAQQVRHLRSVWADGAFSVLACAKSALFAEGRTQDFHRPFACVWLGGRRAGYVFSCCRNAEDGNGKS